MIAGRGLSAAGRLAGFTALATEVAVMSLSARDRHALDSIECWLAGSDPELASKMDTFTRLTQGEAMPWRERLHPRRSFPAPPSPGGPGRRLARRLSQPETVGPGGRLARRLSRQQVAVLVWIVISAALLMTGLAVTRSAGGGSGGCNSTFVLPCSRPSTAQTVRSPAAHQVLSRFPAVDQAPSPDLPASVGPRRAGP
jgi:hypothetical protein